MVCCYKTDLLEFQIDEAAAKRKDPMDAFTAPFLKTPPTFMSSREPFNSHHLSKFLLSHVGRKQLSMPSPDAQCMVYSPIFTLKTTPNVGK